MRDQGSVGRIACFLILILAAVPIISARSDNLPGQAQSAPPSFPLDEEPFLAENDAAMAKMMQGMAEKPSGDVDRDFVMMMTAHHQGAIDMATALLRHGHNEQLKRLAQEIIVTQQQEIAAMKLAIGDPLPPSTPAPTEPSQ
jgi:uncharacterized protein (DUF305 family)